MTIPAHVAALLARLDGVHDRGDAWEARCPAHDDRHASLCVSVGDDGRALLCCQAKCETQAVVAALGLSMRDLFEPSTNGNGQHNANGKLGRIVATYDYRDEQCTLLFQACRFDPKDFRQRQPNGKGGWIWSMKGVKRVLYRLPELKTADSLKVVFVSEGEKDVDNLCGRGVVATTNVGGAGKWRKEYAKHLKGRRVAILPDNDQPGKDHAEQIANALAGVAREVKIIELPDLPPKGDVSDFLAAGGTVEKLLELVEAAQPWEPIGEDANSDGAKLKLNPQDLVRSLAAKISGGEDFAQNVGGKLYRFVKGVYKSKAEDYVRRAVKRLLEDAKLSSEWSSHRANEVVEYIRVDAALLWDEPPLDVLNVANGLLDIKTRTLRPHDPAFLSAIQLPVEFDPTAKCPNTEKFVGEVYPPDAIDLAWELRAWLMRPDKSHQRAGLLLGEGANGKSTELAAIVAFLGRQRVSGVSLHRLESDKFSCDRLIGMLANICPDLPSEHLASTSIFKALTDGTGDTVSAEFKFKDSFDYRPFARLVFSANHPPRSEDASHAFFRRWLVVPFDRTFDATTAIPRPKLDAMLADPAELSGVLNKALDAVVRIGERGLVETESMRGAWDEFRATTDPLSVWLESSTVTAPDLMVAKAELLAAYNRDAVARGRPTLTGKAFGSALVRLRRDVREAQRTIAGRPKIWVWLGMGLPDRPNESRDSRDSRDSPYLVPDKTRENQPECSESSASEQDRENPVNPVNVVTPFALDDDDYERQERAAIMEFEGGLPRPEAERLAGIEAGAGLGHRE